MLMADYGIVIEIIGFILLLLTTGRNPHGSFIVSEQHKESKFDTFREKIIKNDYVYSWFIVGVIFVITGLILQFSFYN